MLHAENDDLPGGIVHGVDEISVTRCHEFAHVLRLLKPTDLWKQDEVLQAFVNRRSNCAGRRVSKSDVVGDGGDILQGARRKPELHRAKRRKAASTSESVA